MKQEWKQLMFVPVFEEAGTVPSPEPSPEPGVEPNETFTKEQVEDMIKHRLSTSSEALEKMKSEVEALRQRTSMSASEKKEIEDRLEQIQNETLTKEQLASKQIKKAKLEHDKKVEELTGDLNNWKSLHTNSTIERDLLDAASSNDAYKPAQLVQLLRGESSLVEELDEEKKPTGRLITKVSLRTKGDDGKPVILKLSAREAVKHMKDMEDFENLFKYEGRGGFGNTNRRSNSGGSSLAELAKNDPKEYIKQRMAGDAEL